MKDKKFLNQTRVMVIKHPDNPDVVLFEAVVSIRNLNKVWVEKITNINIAYKLKEKN